MKDPRMVVDACASGVLVSGNDTLRQSLDFSINYSHSHACVCGRWNVAPIQWLTPPTLSHAHKKLILYLFLAMPPLHLCFIISVVFLLLGFSWYINYESMMEEKMDQFKLFFMLCPLLLLLLVQFLSRHDQVKVPFNFRLPNQESIHRAGGTPWGVAALLVFLLIMVSHQASLRESWFPLLSK